MTWVERALFLIGLGVLALCASIDAKLIGLGLMLYGALGHAVDSLAATMSESISRIEERLSTIERTLSK